MEGVSRISRVNVNKEISIKLDENESNILQSAFDVLKDLRHKLFLQDDDSDQYWCVDGTMDGLRDVLSDAGIFVKG